METPRNKIENILKGLVRDNKITSYHFSEISKENVGSICINYSKGSFKFYYNQKPRVNSSSKDLKMHVSALVMNVTRSTKEGNIVQQILDKTFHRIDDTQTIKLAMEIFKIMKSEGKILEVEEAREYEDTALGYDIIVTKNNGKRVHIDITIDLSHKAYKWQSNIAGDKIYFLKINPDIELKKNIASVDYFLSNSTRI